MKRKASNPKESNEKRKEAQKTVAVTRASHFARAGKQTASISSTPTGVFESKNTNKKG